MNTNTLTLTFQGEKKLLSEKILICQAGEEIGYSLMGQYVTLRKRRYAFVSEKFKHLLRIYYTPKDYARLVTYGNNFNSAQGIIQYRDKLYTVKTIFHVATRYYADHVSILKEEVPVAEMQVTRKGGLFLKKGGSGTIRLHSWSDKEEMDMLLAMLFAGKDHFKPEQDREGELSLPEDWL